MYVTVLLFLFSVILSLVLTPVVRLLGLRLNIVDQPDNKRKVHKKPIPRIGGVAVTIAYFGSCLLVWGLLSIYSFHNRAIFSEFRALVPAVLLIFAVGLADDLLNLQPWHKFAAQGIASVIVISNGIYIQSISTLAIPRPLGMLATVVWLMACTNAVNLIDGLDGLASGTALLGTLTVLIGSLMSGNTALTVVAAPLAGALVGFLVFNFNPASIFLGDCGSLVLGFLLGCFSLIWMEASSSVIAITAPVMALSVPLLDTVLAMLRRFLAGKPLFRPDRSHIHHRLLLRGFSHRDAVLCLYAAASVAGMLALSLIQAQGHWRSIVLAVFLGVTFLGIRQLRFVEFRVLGQIFLNGGLRSEINAEVAVQSLRERLGRNGNPGARLEELREAAREFGFVLQEMRLKGHTLTATPDSNAKEPLAVRIHLSGNDWIELGHDMGSTGHLAALVPFVRTLRTALSEAESSELIAEQESNFAGRRYATASVAALEL